jgi:hypothetical protein
VELPTASQLFDRYVVAMANAMQYDFTSGEITGGTDNNGASSSSTSTACPAGCGLITAFSARSWTDRVIDAIGGVAVNNAEENPVEPVIINS